MRRMLHLLGAAEAEQLFGALEGPSSVGLRVNTLRGDRHTLAARLPWELRSVPWCPAGFVVAEGQEGQASTAPGVHPYQLAGVYYLQDPAAMAVAEALAPASGDLVLDLAAAPGGKSTHLAALLAGTGWLVANDVHAQRAQALAGNLERFGVANATVTTETPARLAALWPGRFDRVLLDAPCSGEGMFRKSTDALQMWSEENVRQCAARQDDLLLEAARLVRPGGYLAYSTCTLTPEENEGSVARFVRRTGFEVVPLALPGTAPGRPEWAGSGLAGGEPGHQAQGSGAKPTHLPELAGAARIWPHRAPGEGHFVALLRRPADLESEDGAEGRVLASAGRPHDSSRAPAYALASGAASKRKGSGPSVPRPALEAWREFARGVLTPEARMALEPTHMQGDWLVRAHHEPAPVKWLRHGLQLGQVRAGYRAARLEPAHALAMALPAAWTLSRLPLAVEDGAVARFMRGEEIAAPGEPGYVRVEVEGFPLGWGKRSGQQVRSLLPKGLRRNL